MIFAIGMWVCGVSRSQKNNSHFTFIRPNLLADGSSAVSIAVAAAVVVNSDQAEGAQTNLVVIKLSGQSDQF